MLGPEKDWHTLVAGPDGSPTPYRLPEKERTAIRSIPGALLYECEAHALHQAAHYASPPVAAWDHRGKFIPWKQSVRLYVLPAKPGRARHEED